MKEKLKEFWAVLKEIEKTKSATVNIVEGFEVAIKYQLSYYRGEVSIEDITHAKLKVSKDFKKVIEVCNLDENDLIDHIDYSDYIDTKEIETKVNSFFQDDSLSNVEQHLDDRFGDIGSITSNYTTFESFWKDIKDELEELGSTTRIKLNSEYDAVVKKDTSLVEVGCQQIPISAIAKILEEYNKING